MTRWLRSIVDVRSGEVALTLLMFLYYYLLLVTHYLLKPARDGLFLVEIGPQQLPVVFMLIAVIVVPITTLYARAGQALNLRLLANATTLVLVVNLFLLRWILEFQHPAVYYTFYIWVSIYGALSASQFWLMANAVFDAAQARRLFVLLGLGGIVGAFTGGELTSLFVNTFAVQTRDLLFICIALLLVCTGLINIAWARYHRATGPKRPARWARRAQRKDKLTDTLSIVTRSRYLLMIVGIIATAMAVTSFTDYQFKTLSAQAFTNQIDLTSFLGKFYGRLSLFSFVIQLFLSYRILRWFGVGGAILLLPFSLLSGSIAMLLAPTLVAGVLLRGSEGVFRYSIDKTARELLFLPVPLEVKKRTKVFIDIFVDRWFRGLAGAALFVLITFLHFDVRSLSFVVVALVLVWIVMAFLIRKEYINAFRSALERREIDVDGLSVNVADTATVATLRVALSSPNERQVIYALEVLGDVGVESLGDAIAPLLRHESAEVRAKSLRALARAPGSGSSYDARELLGDSDPTVRRNAMHYVCDIAEEGRHACLERFLADDDVSLRATAVGCIGEFGNAGERALLTESLIESLLAIEGPGRQYARRQVAEALGTLSNPEYRRYLVQLLEASSPDVVTTAIRSAGQTGDPAFVPRLLELIAHNDYRVDAREALAAYGDPITGALGDHINDPGLDIPTRSRLCRVLSRIPTQQSVDTLARILDTVDVDLRYNVIRALNSLRARHAGLKFEHRSLGGALIDETRTYYAILQILDVEAPAQGLRVDLLRRSLAERMDASFERIFRLLGLSYSQKDIHGAYLGIKSERKELRASAIEFLDNVLKREVKHYLIPIVDNVAVDFKIRRGEELFNLRIRNTFDVLEYLIKERDPWLKSCALFVIPDIGSPQLFALAATCVDDPHLVVQETARLVMKSR